MAPALFVAAEVLVVVSILAAPLMLGSVPPWSVAVGLVLAVLAFAAVAVAHASGGERFPLHPLGWVFAGVLAFEVFQLVPLPPGLLGLLSPRAADLYDFTLADLGGWPAWRSLSLDPAATAMEVARHGSWLLVFLSAFALAGRRNRARRLIVALGASVAVVVTLAFVQKLLGFESIYGVYPRRASGWLFAAFVNPNHLGAYLDLLAPVCLGLALSTRDRAKAAMWGLVFVLAGATCLLTLSRGGIVALVAGVTIFAILFRRTGRSVAAAAGPPVLVGAVVAVGAYLALDPILAQVATLVDHVEVVEEVRWRIWAGALPLVGEFFAVGAGRGAFTVTYPIYNTIPGHRTFSHAENQLVQAAAELGVIVTLALGVALGWAWLSAARRADLSARQAGLLAGLAGLAVHELTDFATAFGGVAVPAAVALGVVLAAGGGGRRAGGDGQRSRDDEGSGGGESPGGGGPSTRAGKRPSGRRWRRLPAPASLLLGAAITAASGAGLIRGARADLVDVLPQVAGALEAGAGIDEAVVPAVFDRPTDHMLALVAAHAAYEAGDAAAAMRWVTRALYLSPSDTRGHLLAAEILARAGRRDQALLQYRLAAEWGEPPRRVLERAAIRHPAAADLLSAVPDTAEGRLAVVRFLASGGRIEDAWTLGLGLLESAPEDPDLRAILADAALRTRRWDEALAHADVLVSVAPDAARGHALRARALVATGEVSAAAETLEAGLRALPGDAGLSMQLARLHLDRRQDPEAALAVLDTMRLPRGDRPRSRMHRLRGDAHRAAGRGRQAMDAYRTAARIAPGDAAPWVAMGDHLMASDQWERALAAYEEAASRRRTAAIDRRIARARERVEALEAFRTRERLYGDGDAALPLPTD